MKRLIKMFLMFCLILLIKLGVEGFNFETQKVIIHQPSFYKNTHFGFSVAGYKVDNDSWIFVGAPQTMRDRLRNGTQVKYREGAIYRCRINTPNSCYAIPFDKRDWNEARDQHGIYYSENKTDQLLGATLRISDDVIMACAPNYRYVTRNHRPDDFKQEPTGICHVLKDRMRKFEEHAPCRNALWGHHRQGYCQAGFSAAISKNDSSLFISGPGAWYWQGMLFSINLLNKEIKNRYPEKIGEGSLVDSYRGYSMDIGHFDQDTYEDVVISAPRANDGKGFVEIFSSTLKILHTIHGVQMGAYFGASVIAVDLNNDRAEDLVVGSPMFKKDRENFDIGRVDVFIRDKKSKEFAFKNIQLIGFRARSRFGLTLAKLGDVNDDGFNDIAVAAPYDGEDMSGIVYIFRGNSDGINTVPDQIIKGSDYKLKTFGYSMSGGLDLDNNKYPDLIIGAYKSDAVAYVRSRAVVKTWINIQTLPKVIDFDSKSPNCEKFKNRTCMEIEYCVQYYGKAVPNNIRMLMSLELDIEKWQNTSSIRAFFNDTNKASLARNLTFKYEQKKCFRNSITIKKNIRDKLSPIKLRLNLTLPNYDSDWDLMPLFNSKQDSSKIHEIRFLRNCGSDDICTPDLRVTASTESKKYVYGSRENIDLNIQIENVKEDAFEAQCHVTLPYGVDYVKAFFNKQFSLPCSQGKVENQTRIICDIGNPMITGTMKSFTIRVAPENIHLDNEILQFNITATSSNKEENDSLIDNEIFVSLLLDASSELALIGKQYQEQVIYESRVNEGDLGLIESEAEIGPEIIHEYKLVNKGPSQISMSEVLISWQKQVKIAHKNKDLLYLMELPFTQGDVRCDLDKTLVNPLNISIEEDKIVNPEKYYLESRKRLRKKRFLLGGSEETAGFVPTRIEPSYYGNVECSSGMLRRSSYDRETESSDDRNYLTMISSNLYDFYCGSIHCKVGALNTDQSALIRLRFRLWARNLAIESEAYQIKTYAMATVSEMPYTKLNLNLEKFQSTIQIETVAHPKERRQLLQQIDMNIVFLSIIAGVVLLLVLIIILWSCGFFKRFEPHEIERQINDSSSLSDEELSNDVIDVSKECGKAESSRENMNLIISKQKTANKTPKPGYGLNNYESTPTAFPQFNPSFTNTNWSPPKLTNRNLDANEETKNEPNQNEIQSETSTPVKQFSTFQTSTKQANTAFSPLAEKKFFQTKNLETPPDPTENPETLKIRPNNISIKSPKLSSENSYTNKLPPVPKRNSKNTITLSNSNSNLNNKFNNNNSLNGSKQALNLSSNLLDLDTNQKLLLELNSRSNFNRNADFVDPNDANSLLTTMQLKHKLNNFY